MSTHDLRTIADALAGGATGDELARIPLPSSYRAAYIREADVPSFAGVAPEDRDPSRSIHVGEVELPELAPDEVLIAVMASAVNYNTVWSAVFHPVPTFAFLKRLGRQGRWGRRHDRPWHAIGSDAAGVILRTGSLVQRWKPGDEVVVATSHVDAEDPVSQDDAMVSDGLRAWGYETNFGGLADLAIAKVSQILAKPAHLSWEEAAVNTLCNMTAYRMLVSQHGARMKQGDVVLVWGAAGGLGSYATQLVLNGGGVPVAVVSSDEKERIVRQLGCEFVINRCTGSFEFWNGDTPNESEWRRFGAAVRGLVGEDVDIVFEHPGRETMGASVFVAKRGGTVVTCAATSGYRIEYDNRHLWMKLKSIKASHGANWNEAHESNRLIQRGAIVPALSRTYSLDDAAEATAKVKNNAHVGKVAVLCMAPQEGLGIRDTAFRTQVGEDRLQLFRRMSSGDGNAALGDKVGVSASGEPPSVASRR